MGLIDWFAEEDGARDYTSRARRRVLVQGAFAAAGVTVIFLINRFWLVPEAGLEHLNMVAAFLVMLATPVVLKLSGRYELAAHLLLIGMTSTVVLDSWLLGGLHSVGVVALMVVPLMATFYLGAVRAFAYLGAIVLCLLGLYVFQDAAGAAPPAPVLDSMRLAALVGIILFIQVFAAVYDTERDQAAARLQAITDSARDGILAVDSNGKITTINPAFRRLVNVSSPMGKPFDEVLPDQVAQLVAATQRTGRLGEAEIELGRRRVGVASASPILRLGDQHGTVLTLRDRTVERELDEMKNVFVSTVSHELRTPMTSVLGFAKLIRSKLEGTVFPTVPQEATKAQRALPKVMGNLDIIISEGERLTNLITDLLDVAKMEAGRMVWEMAPVSPNSVAERAIDATGGLFEGRPVRMVPALSPNLPVIQGDEARLLQLLINLIANAAKFTEEGTVELRAAAFRGTLRFEVIDTGPGIPESELEAIFDRFRQASANAGTKGSGLGLAICSEIAAAHRGKIGVQSVVGEGSTFWLELPV